MKATKERLPVLTSFYLITMGLAINKEEREGDDLSLIHHLIAGAATIIAKTVATNAEIVEACKDLERLKCVQPNSHKVLETYLADRHGDN